MKRICQSCGQRYGEACPVCGTEWLITTKPHGTEAAIFQGDVRANLGALSGYAFRCHAGHVWKDGEGGELRGSCRACLSYDTVRSGGWFVMPPGVLGGPCLQCHHSRCVLALEEAAMLCAYCEAGIGYEKIYLRLPDGRLAHRACEEQGISLEPKEAV